MPQQIIEVDLESDARYAPFVKRYRQGEWRAPILLDLIKNDINRRGRAPAVLDIGCGRGFDDDLDLQRALAAHAGSFIGVEPDIGLEIGSHFTEVHRSSFEDAAIPPSSIDVAYAIMVLEHINVPQRFWHKVYEVLAPGGVFWGVTVDGRHAFAIASYWSERLRLKESYLRLLIGRRGEERYLNYPVRYRANTPRQLSAFVKQFCSCEILNFSREGQLRAAMPGGFKKLGDLYDKWVVMTKRPGALLVIRAVKCSR
jgi:SAM-dependent methyltransferase